MKPMKTISLVIVLALIAGIANLSAQQADMQDQIAMIKKNLADSKAKMKTYEWIETTTVFVSGDQKNVIQKQCYYDVNGNIVKVETGGSAAAPAQRGIRGKVAENQKDDMVDYVNAAVAKIQTYLPPNPDKVQAIYAAGKVTVGVLAPNTQFKLTFPNYNEPGDFLAISINKPAASIMAVDVSTTVDDPSKFVAFNITYSTLPDGTQYAGTTTLNAPEKDLKITIVNSGFKKSGN
jgi:hypothetical protein